MNIKPLFVVTLWAQEVGASAHFYRDVLGLPILPHHGSRPHLKVGETILTILKTQLPIDQSGQTSRFPCMAFEVDKLVEAVQNLKNHGVELPWASRRMPTAGG
jgi:catechol-2,3-dioxygenase